MTVRELVERLSEYEQDLPVVTMGYEGGLDDPRLAITAAIIDGNWSGVREQKRCPWEGRHDYADEPDQGVRVLVIGR